LKEKYIIELLENFHGQSTALIGQVLSELTAFRQKIILMTFYMTFDFCISQTTNMEILVSVKLNSAEFGYKLIKQEKNMKTQPIIINLYNSVAGHSQVNLLQTRIYIASMKPVANYKVYARTPRSKIL
jgi:hypothetical protein